MKVKISIEKLRELVEPDVLNQILEDSQQSSRLLEKYGEKISSKLLGDVAFLLKVLNECILIMEGNEVYSLPKRVVNKELKLYYRTLKE
jgi:hypothetical protein